MIAASPAPQLLPLLAAIALDPDHIVSFVVFPR